MHKILLYSRIGINENNMKIRVWTVCGLCVDRKARNHCQDVDNCGDEDHCQTGNCCQDREHCLNGNEHACR